MADFQFDWFGFKLASTSVANFMLQCYCIDSLWSKQSTCGYWIQSGPTDSGPSPKEVTDLRISGVLPLDLKY